MYVILVYDFGERRVSKMLKLCRKYLTWIQNSVFEGDISELQLKQLEASAKEFMDPDEDSIIIFSSRSQMFMDKRVIGLERNSTDNFLWFCFVDVDICGIISVILFDGNIFLRV